MKIALSNVSPKMKYARMLLAVLLLLIIAIYLAIIHPESAVSGDKMFIALAAGELIPAIVFSCGSYGAVKNDLIQKRINDIMRNRVSGDSPIIDTVSDGIMLVDSKGKIKSANRGLCNILGLEESQLISKSIYSLFEEWSGNRAKRILPEIVIESLETQKEFRQQEEVFIRGTEIFYLLLSTYILRNNRNNVMGVFVVVHDFTKDKKLEQQLVYKEKLVSAGQLVAELAHEIKNPICSIKGLIQILGKKYCLEGNKYYEVIMGEIERIGAMLQGFLTLTQSRPDVETVNVNSIFKELMPLIESYAERKSIIIGIDMQREIPCIDADRESIKQVVVNLVQNGIDALPEHGNMNICVWHDQINNLVKMEFKDNGEGIKPEHLHKIFEPFFTTKKNGSGLGLAISRRIIEAYGGRLFAFNNQDGGATFVVELPVARQIEFK